MHRGLPPIQDLHIPQPHQILPVHQHLRQILRLRFQAFELVNVDGAQGLCSAEDGVGDALAGQLGDAADEGEGRAGRGIEGKVEEGFVRDGGGEGEDFDGGEVEGGEELAGCGVACGDEEAVAKVSLKAPLSLFAFR